MIAYDRPFFKVLSKNDCGPDTNQGGPAIPRDLWPYLPALPDPGPSTVTEETFLLLDLFDGDTPVGTVNSRWHYQTWSGTRAPEGRITQGLKPRLLKTASEGDILVFQRRADCLDRYRVTLVRGPGSAHASLLERIGGARWGALGIPPTDLTSITDEVAAIRALANGPFSPVARDTTLTPRLIRDAAFRSVVLAGYDRRCAACGTGLVVPIDKAAHLPPCEPEAAHIIPVDAGGPDDPRNGLALCRTHHWAFDRLILYVDEHRLWRVVDTSKRENRNDSLNDLDGLHLAAPVAGFPHPHEAALAWRREQVLAL
ncbi:MAG: HNH endonuclease [Dehalococcoidia bacterium]